MSSQAEMLRRESAALAELGALQRDPVFLGAGVPRGDGRCALVLPGLFGNDLYLQPLHAWLRRIGYRPVPSSLAVNAGCPERLRNQVDRALRRRRNDDRGPVALIGHSRGGMLAWAMASALQADASHLVLLGSPAPAVVALFRQGSTSMSGVAKQAGASKAVAAAGARALQLLDPDCNVPACDCPYPQDLRHPLHPSTKVLAVTSRDDQIVAPVACRVAAGTNVEVGGTHSGLVYNREVYPVIARFLAS
jgi:pimeloyl-ACP methyl ester carboxylesterase